MRILFAALILSGIGILAYVMTKKDAEAPPHTIEQIVEIASPEVVEQPEIRYPIPEQETPEPEISETETAATDTEAASAETVKAPQTFNLPALSESDAYIQSGVERLDGAVDISELIDFSSIVEKFVITIDNLTSPKLPVKFRFFAPVGGKFMVLKEDPDDETAVLDPQNYARYEPFIQLAEMIDLEALSRFYIMSYRLFQQAHEELGYPEKYFNDRLIEVIDHLLATPNVQDPIYLTQPKVFYTFSDPDLEALSSGQKLLIRIGPANALRIKDRLKILRSLITT